jgi:hypothetical protein
MGGWNMLLNGKLCADAGTVNCPCYLAEYGKCIVCSRLGGSGTTDTDPRQSETPGSCDCQWQGMCIYNEYLQNNLCIKDGGLRAQHAPAARGTDERRCSRLCKIQKIKWFDDDLAVMRISVPRGMAEKASLPGSFVFVREPDTECCFDLPVSVMRSDYEGSEIEVAIKVMGPKSKALLDRYRKLVNKKSQIGDSSDCGLMHELPLGDIMLRGVYRNGLPGAEKLMKSADNRVLCLVKGVGIAPVANYIRWAEGKHRIDVIADLEKINLKFAKYVLGDLEGLNSVTFEPLPHDMTWAQEEEYDVIIISASDYFQQNIYVPESKLVLSNNHRMCCGEGVCGACMCMGADGKEHRTCKECLLR